MRKIIFILVLFAVIAACRQPFLSPVSELDKDVLCIEGFINTGNESSVITLSRLQDLKDTAAMLPELKAKVLLQEEGGNTIALAEEGKGKYVIGARTYDATKRYRLEITRSNGRKYQSQFVKPTTTPPIDKVGYKLDSLGIRVVVDTHNTNEGPRYYYWDHEETWLFSVPNPSQFYFENNKFIKRTQSVEFCYRTEKSNKIVLGSTFHLKENIIKEQEVQLAERNTGRISLIYSINVKQHAIDKDYFDYLEKVKRNTESIGSIFDAQPTQNVSNIVNPNNPDEMVVGYFNMHSVQQKRLFVTIDQLPSYLRYTADSCHVEQYDFWFVDKTGLVIDYMHPEQYFTDPRKYVPIIYVRRGDPAFEPPFKSYVTGVAAECGDCTLTGVLAKPSFWPY